MSELSWPDVDPLFSAFRNPDPAVRLAALRAAVRLPLAPPAWLEVSDYVTYLLNATPEGPSFDQQTLDGLPFDQVIETAVFVPVLQVREALYWLLESEDPAVRWATAQALARARDPQALPELLRMLEAVAGEARAEVAELLSLLDVTSALSEVEQIYRQEADPDARFWLAVALAGAGNFRPLEALFHELDAGRLYLRRHWGDPLMFSEKLRACGPFPPPVRDRLQQIAAADDLNEFVRQMAADLLLTSQEQPAAPLQPPPEPPPNPDLERRAAELARQVEARGGLEQALASGSPLLELLPYLAPEPATRLVTALFRDALHYSYAFSLGNQIVEAVFASRRTFAPDLEGLFEVYMGLWDDAGVEAQGVSPDTIRWQLAWTVARAGLPRLLAALAPHLETGQARERALAARLIEDASRYVTQDYPPVFGGGGAPADTPPRITEWIEETLHAGNGGERSAPPSRGDGGPDEVPMEEPVDEPAIDMEWDRDEGEMDEPVDEEPMRGRLAFDLPPGEPADEVLLSLARKTKARVANTGFAPTSSPDEAIDPHMPLRAGEAYYFWLDIGRPARRSIEVTPTDIPDVPAEARLTATLVGFKDEIQVTPGADVGELQVKGNGAAVVTRQPLGAQAPQSAKAGKRLFFPVQTPTSPGTYRMRCNIYWGQILLQSRLIHAAVRQRPRPIRRGPAPLRSVLDYTLARALNPAHLNRLSEHRLSVMLNANEDGSHSMHIFGSGDQGVFKNDDVRFQSGELHGMINQARQTLRIAAWGNPDEWQQGVEYRYKDRQMQLARLKNDLINMAAWGYEFYTLVRARLAGGEAAVVAFENLMRTPAGVQLAMKESPSYVLPAAMIYDYPLDVGAPDLDLCAAFVQALEARAPLEDLACFQGNCPNRDDLTIVCPGGFWGFRHFLGMPLSVQDAPDVPPEIPVGAELVLSICVATDLQLRQVHEQTLKELRQDLRWIHADTRDEVFDALKATPHVVYFYCHGGIRRGAPYLQVGPREHPGLIYRSNIIAHQIVWDRPRPLVFLNG